MRFWNQPRRGRFGRSAVCIDSTIYALLVFGLAACGGDGGSRGGAEQTPASAEQSAVEAPGSGGSGYSVITVENGGSISGTITLSGTVPAPRTIAITDDVEACGASVEVQDLAVGAGGGLANVVVSLTDITSGASLEVSASPPTLDQHRCRFTPHVVLVAVDEVLEIVNSDDVSHNVHTMAFDNRSFNRTQPPALEKVEATFSIAEKVGVKCDIHGWMNGWIVVIDHPYHAVTGGDGGFVIENVPPGTYTLEVWHEALGATTQTVTVAAGQTSDASVELTQSSQ